MSHPLTLSHIQVIPFRLPMEGELRWGQAGRIQELHHALIRVHLSDGTVGVAEAPPRPTIYGETVSSIAAIVKDEFLPRLAGLDLTPQLEIWHRFRQEIPTPGRGWVWPAWTTRLAPVKRNETAKGALDMALHHALAQHQGISLAQHLGASRSRVRVSYILGMDSPAAMLAEAQRVVARGVRVLKVKVGQNWEQDAAVLSLLHEILGDEVWLYGDANEGLTDAQAPRRLSQLADLHVRYCEEPLPVHRLQARAVLRSGAPMPLIADDSCFSLPDLERELAFNTFDILNLKPARTGFTESLAMLARARQRGKGIMVGSQASAGLGTWQAALLACHPAVAYPCELSFFLKLKSDILNRSIPIRDGYIALADLAGLHLDPDSISQIA